MTKVNRHLLFYGLIESNNGFDPHIVCYASTRGTGRSFGLVGESAC